MNAIVFGWPPKDLSPNARVSWQRKYRATKAYRTACWAMAKQAGAKVLVDGPITVELEFVQPDRRQRDLDNMIASSKALLDGLALALGVNDNRFRLICSVSPDIGGMVKAKVTQ